jgi:hypothetical protein
MVAALGWLQVQAGVLPSQLDLGAHSSLAVDAVRLP